MRITLTISDDATVAASEPVLLTVSQIVPKGGAIGRHLTNLAEEATDLILASGLAALGPQPSREALERKINFWRNLYIEDECPTEDEIAAFDAAAEERE